MSKRSITQSLVWLALGGLFAWLCVAGLLGAIAWVILRWRQKN